MNKNYLCDYVKYVLDKNGIKVKDKKTCKYLTSCIENIIFNVVSIIAVITFINNSKTIKKESIEIVTKYLNNTCGKPLNSIMKGGGGSIVMPSEFYGVNSMNYSPTNNLHTTDTLQIDFNSGIMRPQIGGGDRIKRSSTIPIMTAITDILNYYKLKGSNELKMKILKLIVKYIKCLITKLKDENKIITCDIIDKNLKSTRLFDIFK
jgi:hypothetical protein